MAPAAGCVDSAEVKGPVLWHAPTRKSVGYFGAVRRRDGRFVFRAETGKFNGLSSFSISPPTPPGQPSQRETSGDYQ